MFRKNVAIFFLHVELWDVMTINAVEYLSRDISLCLEDIWPQLWTERAYSDFVIPIRLD
jgi:hypothetical protein